MNGNDNGENAENKVKMWRWRMQTWWNRIHLRGLESMDSSQTCAMNQGAGVEPDARTVSEAAMDASNLWLPSNDDEDCEKECSGGISR